MRGCSTIIRVGESREPSLAVVWFSLFAPCGISVDPLMTNILLAVLSFFVTWFLCHIFVGVGFRSFLTGAAAGAHSVSVRLSDAACLFV